MHHIYILITLVVIVTSQSDCRFAFKYSQEDLKTKPEVLSEFLKTVVQWESKFAKTIGIDAASGLTLDGQQLDVTTGEPYGPAHQFTASSKESIHVALLALALDNNTYAKLIYTEEEAVSLLERKIKTYENFDQDYPGYGGFLPWVAVNNGVVTPTWDWTDGVPSLDNGQLFWATYGLVAVLEKTNKYPDLTSRYTKFYTKMAQNAPKIFYEGGGLIRAVTKIKDVKLAVDKNQYTNRIQDCTDFNQPCYLDDPYEGELFAWMMHLFSPISTLDRDSIWIQKRTKLQSSQFTVKSTGKQITVEKGWWFSAHEQWKYLFFPYLSNQLQQKLVSNAEKARTWDAKQNGRPGMFASVTGNITSNSDQVYYFSDCGVQEVAFQKVSHDQLVTPYSTMAMFLVNRTVAAVWYHNMISGPAGQNQYGSTEGVTINGQSVSPFVTWDSKITTVLGIAGGIQDQISIKLFNEGLLKPVLQLLDKEWSSVFTDIKGTDIEFAYPDVKVPLIKKDFTTCQLQITE